jgi:hypothetical protein
VLALGGAALGDASGVVLVDLHVRARYRRRGAPRDLDTTAARPA